MGIAEAFPHVQWALEFRNVGVCGGRKTGEQGKKPRARTRTNNKLNPDVMPRV